MQDLNFTDYFMIVWRKRKLLFSVVAVSTIMTLLFCVVVEKKYEATTTIMSSSSQDGLSSALSGAGLSLLGGLTGSLQGDSFQRLWNVLTSKSVGVHVVETLGLTKIIFADDWDEKKQQWKDPQNPRRSIDAFNSMIKNKIVSYEEADMGLLRITAQFPEAQTAKAITDQYLASLQHVLNNRTFSAAKQKRLFLEEQLKITKAELLLAEEALKEFHEKYGVVALDEQAEQTLVTLTGLRAQISQIDLQLTVLKSQGGLNNRNPQVRSLRQQRQELIRQQNLLIKEHPVAKETAQQLAQPSAPVENDFVLNLHDFPQLAAHFFRYKRDVLIREKVFTLLTEQLELAKLEEVKEDTVFEVVDRSYLPLEPFYPKPVLFIVLAMMLSTMMGVVVIFALEYLERSQKPA